LRPKNDYEGAEPAGNAVAAQNFLRLARLTDRGPFREKADRTIRATAAVLQQFPAAMPMMLCALQDSLEKPRQIVIVGDPQKADTQAMWRETQRAYLPNTLLLMADGGEKQKALAKHLPFLESMRAQNGKATA